MTYIKHNTAVISEKAQIGEGTTISEFVVIRGNAIIGKNCHLDAGVIVEQDTIIGDNTKIYQHSVIRRNSVIGKDCIFGKCVMIENNVVMGNEVHIVDLTHITSTCIIEDKVFFGPNVVTDNTANVLSFRNKTVELQGPVIKHGARIGTDAILDRGITIGRNTVVGRGSLVLKDIPDNQLWYGHPARYIREVPKEEWV